MADRRQSPHRERPSSLPGMTLYLLGLYWREYRWVRMVLGAIVGLLLGLLLWWLLERRPPPKPSPPGLVAATFNIRNYPESERQKTAALETIADLDASIVALQEITDPDVFDTQVAHVLGDGWATAYALLPSRPATTQRTRTASARPTSTRDDDARPQHNLGLLYDATRYDMVSVRSHDLGSGRPALEVVLVEEGVFTSETLRVFSVHLKAFDDGHDQRRAQLEALAPIVAAGVASGADVMVLGDFNSTLPADRELLAEFAERTNTTWASEQVECTEFWEPEDDDQCDASALDHAFTSEPPRQIDAHAACAELGCTQDRCSLYYRDVSDHCPLRASW